MGFTHANIELINSDDIALAKKNYIATSEIRKANINVLVDSGAIDLCINEEIKTQLGLDVIEVTSAKLADGSIINVEIAGPVVVKFLNRQTIVNALVLKGNNEPLLGQSHLKDLML